MVGRKPLRERRHRVGGSAHQRRLRRHHFIEPEVRHFARRRVFGQTVARFKTITALGFLPDGGEGEGQNARQFFQNGNQRIVQRFPRAHNFGNLAQTFGGFAAPPRRAIEHGVPQRHGDIRRQRFQQPLVVGGKGVQPFTFNIEHPQHRPAKNQRHGQLRANFDPRQRNRGEVGIFLHIVDERRLPGARHPRDDPFFIVHTDR